MKKIFVFYIFILIFIASCSFDNKSGIWKEHNKKIIEQVKDQEIKIKIFKKDKIFNEEVQNQDIIILSKKVQNTSWPEENLSQTNNTPHLSYINKKTQVSKSGKIGKTKFLKENSLLDLFVLDENIYFSDLSGSIYKYSTTKEEIIWKYNFYKKKFKNIPIKINFKIISNNLIAADSLGYFYKIDINTGKLEWAKNQGVPFTSEIKSYKNKIFLLNQDNKFYIFDQDQGDKVLDFETFPVILKKNNKQTLALDFTDNLFFVTSAGQIFSFNYVNFKINWLKSLKDKASSEDLGIFYSSPIVLEDEMIFLSTAKTTMSLNSLTGQTMWEIPFATRIKPVVSNRFVFLISKSGFLINVDKKNGKIVWSKKLPQSKEFNPKKIGEIKSLLLLSDQIFFTSKNGYFFFINYESGEIINYAKVAKGFYSKPIIANGKIYLIDNNMRLVVFN